MEKQKLSHKAGGTINIYKLKEMHCIIYIANDISQDPAVLL